MRASERRASRAREQARTPFEQTRTPFEQARTAGEMKKRAVSVLKYVKNFAPTCPFSYFCSVNAVHGSDK